MTNADRFALTKLLELYREREARYKKDSASLESWVDREEAEVKAATWAAAAGELEKALSRLKAMGENHG